MSASDKRESFAAYEKRGFAEVILAELDAQHQIPRWQSVHPHGYTEEYKQFVIEALEWMTIHGVTGGGVVRRVLAVTPERYRPWFAQYHGTRRYIPQYAHEALKHWTPGADPRTVVPFNEEETITRMAQNMEEDA